MTPLDSPAATPGQPMPHGIDLSALNLWLSAKLPGFCGPLSIDPFKGGQSNPTYKLSTPHQTYVLRTKPGPVAKLLPSAHAIERGLWLVAFCSMEMAGESPSITSTSGLSISCKNCRA